MPGNEREFKIRIKAEGAEQAAAANKKLEESQEAVNKTARDGEEVTKKATVSQSSLIQVIKDLNPALGSLAEQLLKIDNAFGGVEKATGDYSTAAAGAAQNTAAIGKAVAGVAIAAAVYQQVKATLEGINAEFDEVIRKQERMAQLASKLRGEEFDERQTIASIGSESGRAFTAGEIDNLVKRSDELSRSGAIDRDGARRLVATLAARGTLPESASDLQTLAVLQGSPFSQESLNGVGGLPGAARDFAGQRLQQIQDEQIRIAQEAERESQASHGGSNEALFRSYNLWLQQQGLSPASREVFNNLSKFAYGEVNRVVIPLAGSVPTYGLWSTDTGDLFQRSLNGDAQAANDFYATAEGSISSFSPELQDELRRYMIFAQRLRQQGPVRIIVNNNPRYQSPGAVRGRTGERDFRADE